MSAYKGKPVALVFWASWCGPCKEEMPALARVWDERSDDLGAEILGISVDTETQAPKADRLLRKWKVGFSTTRNQSLQQRFDVSGLPSVRVVGPSGSLRYSSRGYSKKSVEELIEKQNQGIVFQTTFSQMTPSQRSPRRRPEPQQNPWGSNIRFWDH